MSQSGNQTVSLFQYNLLTAEEQNQSITALLGMLMEEPVLYVPAYGELSVTRGQAISCPGW